MNNLSISKMLRQIKLLSNITVYIFCKYCIHIFMKHYAYIMLQYFMQLISNNPSVSQLDLFNNTNNNIQYLYSALTLKHIDALS